MRITTYEKGGNSLNPFIKLFVFFIILGLFVMPVNAITFSQSAVTTTVDGAYDSYAVDMDNDGDMDTVTASYLDNTISWQENTGSQIFTEHNINISSLGACSVYPIDLNEDGEIDIIAADITNDILAWYENDGFESFTYHTIYTNAGQIHDIKAVNLDKVLGIDIIVAAKSGGAGDVIWFENDGSESFTPHSLTSSLSGASDVFIIDLDTDNDFDIISASTDGKLTWFENDGSESFSLTTIDTGLNDLQGVIAADFDNDADIDIISASQQSATNIIFYENNGFESFTENVIDTTDSGAGKLSYGDLDDDTDLDFVSVGYYTDDLYWYENEGNGEFTEHFISNILNGARSVQIVDIDQDGSNDILGTSYHFDAVRWFENSFVMGEGGAAYYAEILGSVEWGEDLYYTGETANITTDIPNFNGASYSYYLDLYNTQEYLTTYEITSETESNYYTFPTEWTDTSLLAKLQRVTDPYGSNEVNLAMDLSHFETLNWDTTISFDKSNYDPGETLIVTWSGAPTSSTIWLRAGNDGEKLEVDISYSGSFEFTVPSITQETYYIADVIINGVSQAQASCVINIGDYWVDDYIYVSNYSFSDGNTYSLHNVDRAEYLNVTTETNIITDFVDVYYNNVYDDKTVSIDHIEDLTGTDQVLKFPNDLGSGQYITIIYYHNVTTGTQAELSYYTNVGEKGEGIDIYNAVITMDDTKEILDVESIAGYGGNDLVVPSDRIVIFDIYADEIINSTTITQDYIYDGDANYNFTSDYHIKRSYLFNVLGLTELQFEVHNDATNTDDIIKYKVYVQGIDQTGLDGSVVMYWTKTEIELNDDVLLYFNVSDMPNNPILTIVSTGDSKYITERTLYTNQTGTESIPDYYKEFGTYTATITCNDIVYAISTLTIIDPDEDEMVIIEDTTFQDNTTSLLNSPYLIGLFIMCVFLAIGATNGIGGTIVTGSIGLGIVCYMGIFPWILLVIEVLVVAALMAKGMINLAGD